MKREIGFAFLALMFVIFAVSLVSAVDTQITVYTYVGHSALINVLDPGSGDALQTFQPNATDSGEIVVTFGSGTRTIDVSIIIRDRDGHITRKHTYTGYTTGSPLSFDLKTDPDTPAPTPVVPVVNVTPVVPVVNASAKDTNSSSWKMPSFSVKWDAKYWTYIYYIIGVIVAIGVIWLLIKFMPKIISSMPRTPAGPVVGKSTADSYRYNTKTDKQLADAERKIKEAQMEIDRIRNKKRIVSEAERKFQEAKRELDRVKDY